MQRSEIPPKWIKLILLYDRKRILRKTFSAYDNIFFEACLSNKIIQMFLDSHNRMEMSVSCHYRQQA